MFSPKNSLIMANDGTDEGRRVYTSNKFLLYYYKHVDILIYKDSLFYKQIIPWKEPDDKKIAIVHLDKKGIEELQDWLE